jgi:hypothetical protein
VSVKQGLGAEEAVEMRGGRDAPMDLVRASNAPPSFGTRGRGRTPGSELM